jgi:hypothetical protein
LKTRELTMKRSLLPLTAVLLVVSASHAAAGVPELNAGVMCRARAADARTLRSPPDQSVADCVRDEDSAKQELAGLWTSVPAGTRKECEREGRTLGTTSYLDLLSCVRTAEDVKSTPKQPAAGK